MPRVSIIIPNYNHARYLRQRVDSVLRQSLQEFELILLDDASTDESVSILREYLADPRVRLVVNDRNSGSPFFQWNRGVAMARGQWVWIAESDDWAEPEFLERMVDVLQRHPSVGLVYCRSMMIDDKNRPLGLSDRYVDYLSPGRWAHDFVARGPEECRKYLFFACTIPNASAVVFRRDLYRSVGGADASLRLTGDWRTWVAMLARSDLAYLARTMNRFRTHPATMRNVAYRSGQWLLEQAWLTQSMVDEFEIPAASVRAAARSLARRWVGWMILAGRSQPAGQSLVVLRALRRLDRQFPWLVLVESTKQVMRLANACLQRAAGALTPGRRKGGGQ